MRFDHGSQTLVQRVPFVSSLGDFLLSGEGMFLGDQR